MNTRISSKICTILLVFFSVFCTTVSAQSLLDGKKWSVAKNVSGHSGTMQGAAYYDGKIYQFVNQDGKDNRTYGIYDIESNSWSAGEALNTGVLASCHFGSACFGPESTKNYTVNGVSYTSSFPLLFVTAHDTKNANGNILIHVIDFEQKSVVTTLKFPHSDKRDDKIAAYDFTNGKIYVFGYPVNVLEGHTPYIVWTYDITSFNTFSSSEIIMSPNLATQTNAHTGIGGPDTDGIQKNLACGTLQDCHYHNGYIYYATSRGSEYNRTEFAKVHALNVSTWEVEKTMVCNNASEPEGFAFDGTNFYMTCGGNKLWKLSDGSGYDANNYQPATYISSGTYEGYYEITNASQFVWFKSMVYNGCTTMKAYLANDIDMTGQTDPFTYYIYDNTLQSGTSTYKFEAQFAFRGTFDGNGYAISNVNITSTPYDNDGLFPYVMGGTIKNVTVTGNIKLTTCKTSAGNGQSVSNVGLVGYMDGGTLENVDVKGLTIDETVAGVDGTINKLIGSENGDVTTTNCVTEDPTSKTHAENGGAHLYINGFCSLSGAVTTENGYYETPEGEGTEASPYLINNAGKLWWFAKYINGGTNVSAYAKLTADINMEGSSRGSFPGIGKFISTSDYSGAYAGTFDGQGHTINNFYRTTNSVNYNGLFAYIKDATVRNFKINGEIICTKSQQHGSVFGCIYTGCTVEDIHSSVTVKGTSDVNQMGGFAGRIMGTVNRCRYSGTIQGTDGNNPYNKFGGFVGSLVGGTIKNCLFDGTMITASTNSALYAGGFAGGSFDAAGGKMQNCLMVGTITSTGTTTGVGVLVGNIANRDYTATNVYYSLDHVQSGVTSMYGVKGSSATASIDAHNCNGMTWSAVKTALNDGSTNWGINGDKADYPIPGEVDKDATQVTQYTITFDSKGGSNCASITGDANSEIVLPTSEKSGFTFDGWDSAEDGTGTRYQGGASYTITADATLYAQWTAAGSTYNNGFKTTGTSADADYYETPALDSDGTTYLIDNAGKLFWFAINLNSGAIANTYNVKITKDIDMEGSNHTDFPGIGYYKSNTDNKAFSGNFDGQKHTITNCNITSTTGGWGSGLIAHADGSSKTIKDFTLEGTITAKCNSYAGGALGYIAKGYAVSGITSSVIINSTCIKTAGLVGFINTGSINKCRFNGTVNSSNSWVGGLVGELAAGVTVRNCLFDGTINCTYDKNDLGVGGITALPKGNTISNCLVYGKITTTNTAATSANAGKVFGRVDGPLTLTNVYYGAQGTSTPTIDYNANGKTITGSVTALADNPDWNAIEAVLNSDGENWGINSKDYPVPGETDGPSITKYTIKFVDWDGTELATLKLKQNVAIVAPANPTRTGYDFTGWSPALEEGAVATQDQTYTAQYSIGSYTITYYVDGTQYGEPDTYAYGATVTARAYPEGENFSGWSPAVPATMPAENLKIYGTFATYENGFNTQFSTCAENLKYQKPSGSGTAEDPYLIDNAGNLYWFALYVNANSKTAESVLPGDELKANAVLTADIDMEGSVRGSFPGIGYRVNYWDGESYKTDGNKKTIGVGLFTGSFNGQGHTISNFYMSNSTSYKALINITGNGASIKNFTLRGQADISGGGQTGSVIGRVEGTTTLEDIHSSVNFTVAAGKTISAIGGIIGQCSGTTTLNRCRYNGTITGNSSYNALGGIVGNAEGNMTFDNCLFDGTISTSSTQARTGVDDGLKIGGIFGRNNNVSTIKNCMSIGTISVPSAADKGNVGIILGTQTKNNKLTITNTYYSTTNCTSGIAAVGNNSNTDTTPANPTELAAEPDWSNICTALNPTSGSVGNWKIVNGQEYPIPMFVDLSHEHAYNKYGYCTICNEAEPIGNPILDSEDGKSYYHIDHLADLVTFRRMVAAAKKGTEFNAKVTADIDVTGLELEWTDLIGDHDHPYCGTFDGQGHSFKGLNATSDKRYVGVFECVGIKSTNENEAKAGIIKNFSVSGQLTASYFSTWNSNTPLCMGVIGEIYNGVVENVHSSVDFYCTSGTRAHIGGVVGGTLHNATDAGTIVIKNCSYTGTINVNASDNIGGIVGYAQHKTWISNTLYAGKIIQNWTRNANEEDGGSGDAQGPISTYIGGVLGYCNSVSNGVKNSIILGEMKSNLTDFLTDAMTRHKNNMNICVGFDGQIASSFTNYHGNYITPEMKKKYHQLPSNLFSGTANVYEAIDFASGIVCAKLNADPSAENDPWGQILGYQVGYDVNGDGNLVREGRYDPNSPAQPYPFPGYTDPNKTSYKVVQTQNAQDNTKYDYTADYYFFDDYGDTTPFPSDAASMKVKRVQFTRKASYMNPSLISEMTGFISVCMPFNVNESDFNFNSAWKVYVFDNVTEDETKENTYNINFTEVAHENIKAGVPYFVQLNESSKDKAWSIYETNEDGYDLALKPMTQGGEVIDENTVGILGSFNTIETGGWTAEQPIYKIKPDGVSLVKCVAAADATTENPTSHCYPYRGYLKLPMQSASSQASYRISFGDESTSIEQIDENESSAEFRYNLYGQRVRRDSKGISIVNGRKVIVY